MAHRRSVRAKRVSRVIDKQLDDLRAALHAQSSRQAAESAQRFFKTGPGEYGEGDVFIGVRVPVLRKLARRHRDLPLDSVGRLLDSAVHEERLLALLIMVSAYQTGDRAARKPVYELYVNNIRNVNNWDLVDASAAAIVGDYLKDRSKRPLYRWAGSRVLWERRIAVVSTYCYIKQDDFDLTLQIAEMLLGDREDLIHKAVGWMLREVGKRDLPAEESFLKVHCRVMPRTMLRYAIERFPEKTRQRYLTGDV